MKITLPSGSCIFHHPLENVERIHKQDQEFLQHAVGVCSLTAPRHVHRCWIIRWMWRCTWLSLSERGEDSSDGQCYQECWWSGVRSGAGQLSRGILGCSSYPSCYWTRRWRWSWCLCWGSETCTCIHLNKGKKEELMSFTGHFEMISRSEYRISPVQGVLEFSVYSVRIVPTRATKSAPRYTVIYAILYN